MFIRCIYRISLSSDKLFSFSSSFLIECLQFYCFFCWPYNNSVMWMLVLLRQIFSMDSKTNKRDPGSCCLGFRLFSTKSSIIHFWSRADLRMHLKRVFFSHLLKWTMGHRMMHWNVSVRCVCEIEDSMVLGWSNLREALEVYFISFSFHFPSFPFFLWLGDGLRWTRVY